jgi:hypothetical protein
MSAKPKEEQGKFPVCLDHKIELSNPILLEEHSGCFILYPRETSEMEVLAPSAAVADVQETFYATPNTKVSKEDEAGK